MTEYAAGRKRGADSFPSHWRGLHEGQTSEQRAAAIIANMGNDLEARGDHAGAEEVRQAFINGADPDAPSTRDLQRAWANNPTAANGLAYVRSLAG